MKKEFRRKPGRKSIIRGDDSRRWEENVESSRERRSTSIKRKIDEHLLKASERGRIVDSHANIWFVAPLEYQTSEIGPPSEYIECHIGGLAVTANQDDTLVCVGDIVRYAPDTKNPGKGIIIEIEERRTKLLRKFSGSRTGAQVIAANVAQCFIVCSAADPFYNKRLIDRYLIAAEQGQLRPIIIVNKIELMDEQFVREDLSVYKALNISVYLISCFSGHGLEQLKSLFQGTISVLVGESGVGKSSIINMLFNRDLQATREISAKYIKGKHTTTSGRLFYLEGSGALIDTPGLREYSMTDLHPEELPFYFHDFDVFYPNCKYLPCSHTHEPGCAVKGAVEQGLIDDGRYDSYLRILESL